MPVVSGISLGWLSEKVVTEMWQPLFLPGVFLS